jgi:hypothetical protein
MAALYRIAVFGISSGMSRRGHTTPFQERGDRTSSLDETTVVRREWERLIDRLAVQGVRTGMAESRKGAMREETERAVLKQLRSQIDRGVRRIEGTFWKEAQRRTYHGILSWAAANVDESQTLQLKDLEAEIRRRLAKLSGPLDTPSTSDR